MLAEFSFRPGKPVAVTLDKVWEMRRYENRIAPEIEPAGRRF